MPLNRRDFLTRSLPALAAGLAVAGTPACDPLGQAGPKPRHSPAAVDPLLALLAEERALLGRYDAVIARFPRLSRMVLVRADHAAHVQALQSLLHAPAHAMTHATPTPASTPITARSALRALRAGEAAAAARATAACIAAPAARAALLGSIAACESAHLVLLR